MATDQALVLAAHGSHHDDRSAEPAAAAADRLRDRGWFDAVRAAYWKEQPSLAEVLETVEAETVYVVPFLTSSGYFADQVFPRELGLDTTGRHRSVVYTDPVGTHDRVRSVLIERIHATIGGRVDDAELGVVVVGHGTDRHPESGTATYDHVEGLRASGRFARVEAAFLDQTPSVATVPSNLDTRAVVVVPLFVSNGHHVTRDIPQAIGLEPGGNPFGGPFTVDGTSVWYTEAVGTAPGFAEVVLERVSEAGGDVRRRAAGSTRRSTAEAAFVDWLGGDLLPSQETPTTRSWGELWLSVDGSSADRRYTMRHRADRDVPSSTLEALPDPAAVRARTRHTDDGSYRPLRTARDLPTGWRFETSEATTFVQGIRAVYPASIDHWYADRRGSLATTDLETVIERQVGRYRSLEADDGRTVSATIEACCSNCVRQRAWSSEGATPAADDGAFPCPEPCSFFLEAARSFTTESVESTPSEAGPSVPAAAFATAGNRYRVAFERALEDAEELRPEASSHR